MILLLTKRSSKTFKTQFLKAKKIKIDLINKMNRQFKLKTKYKNKRSCKPFKPLLIILCNVNLEKGLKLQLTTSLRSTKLLRKQMFTKRQKMKQAKSKAIRVIKTLMKMKIMTINKPQSSTILKKPPKQKIIKMKPKASN